MRFNKDVAGWITWAVIGLAVLVLVGGGYWWWQSQSQDRICLQVLTPAKNNKTGECKTFPDSCIPVGWSFNQDCESVSSAQFPPKADLPLAENAPSSTIDASGWKTYRNEKYGFEVRYPTDYTVTSMGPNEPQQYLSTGKMISGTVPPSYDTIVFAAPSGKISFEIEIANSFGWFKNKNEIVADYPIGGMCGSQLTDKTLINQIVIIDNVKALERKQAWGDKVSVDYCVVSGTRDLLALRYISNSPDTPNNILQGQFDKVDAFLRQILSTFKFIEPADSSRSEPW